MPTMERSVAGTVFSDGRPRSFRSRISIWTPSSPEHALHYNEDKPGFIGRLAWCWAMQVNIANFNLGRRRLGRIPFASSKSMRGGRKRATGHPRASLLRQV